MRKEVLQDALELLAVATFTSPELQAKRTDVINAALQTLAEQPTQRTWVGLEESDMPDGDDPKFIAGMVYAANKLMEKNT